MSSKAMSLKAKILNRGVFYTRPRDYYDVYILSTTFLTCSHDRIIRLTCSPTREK